MCLAVLVEVQLIHLETKLYSAYVEDCPNVIFQQSMCSRFVGDQILVFESANVLTECTRLSKRHFQPECV